MKSLPHLGDGQVGDLVLAAESEHEIREVVEIAPDQKEATLLRHFEIGVNVEFREN